METETVEVGGHQVSNKEEMSKAMKRSLFLVNYALLALGDTAGPLLMRLYFLHGGKRVWLSSWLETGGWPFMLFPLTASYLYRRRKGDPGARFFSMKSSLFFSSSFLGLLIGLDDFLYAFGVSRLPTSTSALIFSTQLAFTAIFSFLIVRQRMTSYSINSVVLLTIGAVVLGIHANGDRPANESNKQYYLGFFLVAAASVLYGFVLPMVELTYKRAKQALTYSLVMEMQMVMSVVATAFCTIGMLVNNDFKVIPREARESEIGETKYYTVLALSAIFWQFYYLGAIGVIFCGSSLLTGVMLEGLLPVTEILAVIFYHEKFKAEKGVALTLCLWGFTSYFYGEFKGSKKKDPCHCCSPSSV